MNLISVFLLLLPLSLAIAAFAYMVRHSQLWIEAFAVITSLTLLSYGVLFSLGTKESWTFNVFFALSVAEFLGVLLWPITNVKVYQKLNFKSVLFDGQSTLSTKVKHIQSSRFLSSLVVFLFCLLIIILIVSATGFIDDVRQILIIVLISAVVSIATAFNWKPKKS